MWHTELALTAILSKINEKIDFRRSEKGPCTLHQGIQSLMEAILACHPCSIHRMTGWVASVCTLAYVHRPILRFVCMVSNVVSQYMFFFLFLSLF